MPENTSTPLEILSDDARSLAEDHGGYWGGHPGHPVADWQYEVGNDDTRRGYWGWVAAQLDLDDTSEHVRDLVEAQDSVWDTHAAVDLESWQHEVEDNDTRLGYWERVALETDA